MNCFILHCFYFTFLNYPRAKWFSTFIKQNKEKNNRCVVSNQCDSWNNKDRILALLRIGDHEQPCISCLMQRLLQRQARKSSSTIENHKQYTHFFQLKSPRYGMLPYKESLYIYIYIYTIITDHSLRLFYVKFLRSNKASYYSIFVLVMSMFNSK